MKKSALYLLVISALIVSQSLLMAFDSSSVLGTWLVPKGDAKVTIYKCGEKFCGKISWMKSPNDLDDKNPDPAKRTKPVLGMVMLWNFVYKDAEWVGGQIYDPDNGKTYKCKMSMKSANKLNVRGYVGAPIFGRTEVWTRVDK